MCGVMLGSAVWSAGVGLLLAEPGWFLCTAVCCFAAAGFAGKPKEITNHHQSNDSNHP
jgi:hypothetical protein